MVLEYELSGEEEKRRKTRDREMKTSMQARRAVFPRGCNMVTLCLGWWDVDNGKRWIGQRRRPQRAAALADENSTSDGSEGWMLEKEERVSV